MSVSPEFPVAGSCAASSTSVTTPDSTTAKDASIHGTPAQERGAQETTSMDSQPKPKPTPPPQPIGETHITTTDSMVTVRLSDAEGLRSLPSPTPTLKLVTDEEIVEEPEQEPSRSSSPEPTPFTDAEQTESPVEVTPPGSFSVPSVESEPGLQRKGVDWEGLERTEDEHTTNDEESEEVCFV